MFALRCPSNLPAEQLPALHRAKRPPLFTLGAGAAGLVTTLCMVLALGGKGAAMLARMPEGGLYTPGAVTALDEQAGQWLRDHAPDGTVFLTNRTSGLPDPDPAGQDGISNVYTAFSGVQCYMEGWTYAVSNMGVSPEEVGRRRTLTDTVFDPATPADVREDLCREAGVTCLVWARRWPGRLPPDKHPVFENAEVAIYWM